MAADTIVRSKFAPVSIPDDVSISQFFTRYNPDNVADDKVVHIDLIKGKELTYGGLRKSAGRGAWGLKQSLDLKSGNVVCILAQNSSDFVLLAHSIWWAGAVVSPINPLLTVKDILHCFSLVKPTHIAVSGAYHEKVQEALQQYRGVNAPRIFTLLDRIENLRKFPEDIEGSSDKQSLPPYDLEGQSSKSVLASIIYSSGTTGKMKGVKVSHYNHVMNILQGRSSVPVRQNSDQRIIFFAPYCHIYGLGTVVLNNMWQGNFTCVLSAFDLETYCQQFSKYKATLAYLVPPIVLMLVASDMTQKYDFSALECIIVAAAPLKEALQKKVKAIFPSTKITQGYGLSECSPSVLMQHESDEQYVGTCGRLLASTEARLVDPISGKDVGVNKEGELWVRGPQTMMGYVNNEAATKETFVGEWLRTGDIMTRDVNDNFWVTDRLKEMIKYKGLQIAPSELEDILLQHSDVVDAAVCAIYDDEQASEVPLAYVSLVPSVVDQGSGSIGRVLDNIREWHDGKVAGYKKLRGGVHHLQQLPKNPSGKILRRELPARIKQARFGNL
ncbi:putative amp dependent CoA ligase [Aaosphaeria arxii CBS 175.79]|uniref:Putative amp dependent CoA ligase n=1 Tax=Aaosphaeria arxii CBS 175.79 TaxID=1450172 RepID=A0A6A5Y9F8_9PLEO|nr:putative amp dependent CoA ligase [Aaosphaeria arxii CBS 175.79]KAF2021647.1 putative amp dependent CoA ligase [Aaosphaeria arxii CBS 175.79]